MTELNLNEIKARAEEVKTWKATYCTEPVPQIVDVDVPALVAEVERLSGALAIARGMLGDAARQIEEATASVVSLSSRRDVLEERCAQMEADHAETVAERDRLQAELDLAFSPGMYLDIQKVLDEALGTEEADGAGAGMVADVALLADRKRAAEAELEQWRAADQRVRDLHRARPLREYDEDGDETGNWLPPICEGCTRPDVIAALNDGELIEVDNETAPWPCPTSRAQDGGAP